MHTTQPKGWAGLWKSLMPRRGDLSWAGPSVKANGFCFGTEEGGLLLTDAEGVLIQKPILGATASGEAVNGVAFDLGRMLVTTRDDARIWADWWKPRAAAQYGDIPAGGHGVTVGRPGSFFLPLGTNGVMSVHHGRRPTYGTVLNVPNAHAINLYKCASFAPGTRQVLAFAARLGGVAVTTYEEKRTLEFSAFKEVGCDFIDISPVALPGCTLAMCALTRDGRVFIYRNALDVKPGRTMWVMQCPNFTGVAYRVVSSGSFLFVLTSNKFHILHLSPTLTRGVLALPGRTRSTSCAVRAVDMNLVGDRWLLLLRANDVLRLDLHALPTTLAAPPVGVTREHHADAEEFPPTEWHDEPFMELRNSWQETVGETKTMAPRSRLSKLVASS